MPLKVKVSMVPRLKSKGMLRVANAAGTGPISAQAKKLEILNRLRKDPAYAPFFAALDANSQPGGDLYTLGRSDWTVQYTPQYIAEHTNTATWITDKLPYTWAGPGTCPTRRRDDLAELTEQHAPGYRPDDRQESN